MTETTLSLRQKIETFIHKAQFDSLMGKSKAALMDARKHHDKGREALALLGLAQGQKFIGKFKDALLLTNGAINLAQELADEHLKIQALLIRASIHLVGTYQIHEAETDYREALSLAHHLNDVYAMAEAMIGIAATLNHQRLFPSAEEFILEAYRLARELNEQYLIGNALHILGSVYGNTNQIDEALKAFQNAMTIAQTENYRILELALMANIGYVLIVQGRYANEGQQMLEKALRMAREVHSIPDQFVIIFWMGRTAEMRGEMEQAGEHYNTMLIRAQEWQTRTYEGLAFFNLGILAYHRHHYDDALANLNQSLMIARETKNPYQEAQIEQLLGMTSSQLQDWDSTLDHFMAARTLYDALENQHMVNQMMQSILMTYVRRFFAKILSWLGIGGTDDTAPPEA